MANQVEKQIVEEGPRNAIVKVSGVLDTVDINLVSYIRPSDFSNNAVGLVLIGFRVDTVLYSMGQALDMTLSWNGAVPQLIVPLARSGRISAMEEGGFVPDATRGGYDGSLNVKSTGFIPDTVQNFTLVIHLVKLYKV